MHAATAISGSTLATTPNVLQMASTTAQLAKDKGNAAFKAADYPAAIGLYTEAIFAKPNDPTFPLNRAAAYLKLGKNEDAERDCTTVITLNPSNVKGFFRRGQARIALNKITDAQKDLREALRLEPANESVKTELKKVENLLLESKSKQNTKANTTLPPSNRRRIPIKIVESANGSSSKASQPTVSSENDLMKPVASRSLISSSSTSVGTQPLPTTTSKSPLPTSPASTSKPSTFKDAKQARESVKPSRASGGIFRPSGDHTIFDKGEKQRSQSPGSSPSTKPSPSTTVNGPSQKTNGFSPTKPPMTLFDFTRSWESLESTEQRWNLISQMPPATLPALFQTSLETSLLVSILDTFLALLKQITDPETDDRARMRQYMAVFSKVPRFTTVVLFMNRKEKELVKEVWDRLGVRNGGAAWGIS